MAIIAIKIRKVDFKVLSLGLSKFDIEYVKHHAWGSGCYSVHLSYSNIYDIFNLGVYLGGYQVTFTTN